MKSPCNLFVTIVLLAMFDFSALFADNGNHLNAVDHLIKTGVFANVSISQNTPKIASVEVSDSVPDIANTYFVGSPNATKNMSENLVNTPLARDDDGGLATDFPGLGTIQGQQSCNAPSIAALLSLFAIGNRATSHPAVDITISTITTSDFTLSSDSRGLDISPEKLSQTSGDSSTEEEK